MTDGAMTPLDTMELYAAHIRKDLPPHSQALVDALVAVELVRQGARPPRTICAGLRAHAMKYRLHTPALAAYMELTANHLEQQDKSN
jgi:hypothetical protein